MCFRFQFVRMSFWKTVLVEERRVSLPTSSSLCCTRGFRVEKLPEKWNSQAANSFIAPM